MNYQTASGKAARAIRAILADRAESIETLSEGTGISLSTLKRRLLGASSFSINELALIAAYFDVPMADVLTPLSERPAVAVAS